VASPERRVSLWLIKQKEQFDMFIGGY